jgi:hypothetical protein
MDMVGGGHRTKWVKDLPTPSRGRSRLREPHQVWPRRGGRAPPRARPRSACRPPRRQMRRPPARPRRHSGTTPALRPMPPMPPAGPRIVSCRPGPTTRVPEKAVPCRSRGGSPAPQPDVGASPAGWRWSVGSAGARTSSQSLGPRINRNRRASRPHRPDGVKCAARPLLAEEPHLMPAHDGLAARGNAELPVDGHRLGLHRVPRHVQSFADLPERQVRGQQRQEAELGRRE